MSVYVPTDGDQIILERETNSRHGFSRGPLLRVVRSTEKVVRVEQSDSSRKCAAWLPLAALSDEGERLGKNRVIHVAPWLVRRADDAQQIVIGLAC